MITFKFGNGLVFQIQQTNDTSAEFSIYEGINFTFLRLPNDKRGTVSNHVLAKWLYLTSVVHDFSELQQIVDDGSTERDY
jgi:hypothetical protein